ncbi:MAG TPA: DUF72 domain-containing protein [Sphingomicrobium sp.]|jgi:uncharacterized protein YecE (DUF72 family)
MNVKIGTAGWSIPRDLASVFPTEGSGLERYAAHFPVAEINSSFHRPHRLSTWERWRESVPSDFRFSVKVPKAITHVRKLVGCEDELDAFISEAGRLGDKLAVLLIQLPPKLEFDADVVTVFFSSLQRRTAAAIVCEPRHLSWFTSEGDALLTEFRVARVAADPALNEAAARPGGWGGLNYWRLHGSPVAYRSSYRDRIDELAAAIGAFDARDCWCIFDNTASSAGAGDAIALMRALGTGF